MHYSTGQVARLARVTIRTLRYYDQIDLLHPSARSEAGQRSYSVDDLERLQRILCYRQLGFQLDQIKSVIGDLKTDPLEHLQRQHTLLIGQINELQKMLATVEKIMEAHKMGINLEPHEILEVFGGTDPAEYHEEAESNWGSTTAWTEAQQHITSYTKDDWKRMQAEFNALMANFAAAYTEKVGPTSLRTMNLAEEHRQYLERWFYICSYRMHNRLGDLYVNDPRFAAKINKFAPDLASYMRDAIHANSERNIPFQTGGH